MSVNGLHKLPVTLGGVLTALLTVLCGLFLSPGTHPASAETNGATPVEMTQGEPSTTSMRFNASLNPAGVLNAIAVTPGQVEISPGGSVKFVNGTSTPMTLRVGKQSVSFPANAERTFQFPGAPVAQTETVSATAVNLPVVGTLVSSQGTVSVKADEKSVALPAPSARPHGAPSPQASASPGSSSAPSTSERKDASVPSGATPAPSTSASPSASKVRSASGGMGEAPRLVDEPRHGSDDGGHVVGPGAGMPNAERAGEVAERLGKIGLLVLVAATLLVGVGSAALRVVVACRGGTLAT